MLHWPSLVFATLACAATPALAQERPSLAPTRDVAITYHFLSQRPGDLHMSIQASTGLTRVDAFRQHGYVIMDRKAQRMTMVMTDQRIYVESAVPAGQQSSPELDPTARFTRHGTDTVAGLACTVWDYTSARASGTACITDDGVLLRSRDSTGQHGLEATEVIYAPQPDADFHPPADFTRKDVPQMPQDGPPVR